MEKSTGTWETIPDEIQCEIASHLDVKSLCFFAATSKRSLKNALSHLTQQQKKLLHPPFLSITTGLGNNTFLSYSSTFLYTCGENTWDQLGHKNYSNTFMQAASFEGKILQLSGDSFHTAMLINNELFTCGNNCHGELCLGHNKSCSTLTRVLSFRKKVHQVIAGGCHTLALSDHELFACGDNRYGQLGLGHTNDCHTFLQVASLKGKIKQVVAGSFHTLMLTGHGLFACGSNESGQLGLGHYRHCNTFTCVTSFESTILHVCVGSDHTLVLTNEGLFTCGYNYHGQLGLGHKNNCNIFTRVTSVEGKIHQVMANYSHTFIRTDHGLFACGSNEFGQLGLGNSRFSAKLKRSSKKLISENMFNRTSYDYSAVFVQVPLVKGKILHVSLGREHTFILTDQGLFACGRNNHGELGLGHYKHCNTFTLIQQLPKEIKPLWSLYRHIDYLQTIATQHKTLQQILPRLHFHNSL